MSSFKHDSLFSSVTRVYLLLSAKIAAALLCKATDLSMIIVHSELKMDRIVNSIQAQINMNMWKVMQKMNNESKRKDICKLHKFMN